MQPQGIPIEAREVLLKRASQGTINFAINKLVFLSLRLCYVSWDSVENFILFLFSLFVLKLNRSPWMVETNPKEVGLGIYV